MENGYVGRRRQLRAQQDSNQRGTGIKNVCVRSSPRTPFSFDLRSDNPYLKNSKHLAQAQKYDVFAFGQAKPKTVQAMRWGPNHPNNTSSREGFRSACYDGPSHDRTLQERKPLLGNGLISISRSSCVMSSHVISSHDHRDIKPLPNSGHDELHKATQLQDGFRDIMGLARGNGRMVLSAVSEAWGEEVVPTLPRRIFTYSDNTSMTDVSRTAIACCVLFRLHPNPWIFNNALH